MVQYQYLHRSHTPGPELHHLQDHRHSRRTASVSHNHRHSSIYDTSPLPPSYRNLENNSSLSQHRDQLEAQFRHLSMRQPSHISGTPDRRGGNNSLYGRMSGREDHSQRKMRLHDISHQGPTGAQSRSSAIAGLYDQQDAQMPREVSEPSTNRPRAAVDRDSKYPRGNPHESVYNKHEQREARQRQQSADGNLRQHSMPTGPFGPRAQSPHEGPRPQGQRPTFIIVGLFVLRLARRLMDKLDPYPEKDADAGWIDAFLSQYSADYDLAELRGFSMDIFAKTWPVIINHFIKQPKYPLVFTRMNPIDTGHESQRLSDKEIKAMVDFADAAAEWGSVVKLPGHEAQRIEFLASQRKVAAQVFEASPL